MANRIPLSLLIFIVIVPLIFFLQSKLLAPHLRYGFADVDWGFLLSFKQFSAIYYDPVNHLISAWRAWGVYTYQVYYMGILEHFFPIDDFNFINFHKATHFFKFLSAITLFPLVLVLTSKRLLAALATILYAVAYPAVGPIYAAAVSGNYPAIAVMNLFLAYYIFIVKNNKMGVIWLGLGVFLFLLTLFLSTERMYPLIPLIILGEFFWVWIQKFSHSGIRTSIIRVSIFLSPLVIYLLLKILGGSSAFGDVSGFFGNTKVIFQKISEGNWHLALYPQISLASLFFPREYWGLIGSDKYALNSLVEYLGFSFGPFSLFFISTLFLSLLLSKRPLRFILVTSALAIVLNTITYILASHNLSIDKALRMHFDTMFMKAALVGAFILSLIVSLLIEWVLTDRERKYPLYLFLGSATAFLFIFLTWLPSDHNLLFLGVHRYLAIPAIGSSLFIATLITLLYEKINKIKILRNFSWIILLIIVPLIQLNFYVVGKYFDKELNDAGTDGVGQIKMKSELLSYMGDFDLKEPTLFYLDEQDRENGYFHETAIIAGFNPWIRFRGKSTPLLDGIDPQYIRNSNLGSETNVYCTGQIVDCHSKLKDYITVRNGQKGILYKDVFYPPDRFYAFRLKNRDVFDIKKEVLQEIGL